MAARSGSSINNGYGKPSWRPDSSHLNQKNFRQRDDTPARSNTNTLLFEMAEPVAVAEEEEEERQKSIFKELYRQSEARIAQLFGRGGGGEAYIDQDGGGTSMADDEQLAHQLGAIEPPPPAAPKKSARTIDEDNYDDDDEEDEDEEDLPISTLKNQNANALMSPSKSGSSPVSSDISPLKPTVEPKDDDSQPKSSEDVRKQLEEQKKATEEAAKHTFHTVFYTLENDRVAMLEQLQLEETEMQINAEMDNTGTAANTSGASGERHSTLSSANLGASNLTLKHLIARIDLKREKVKASDAELRALMNEVRKHRTRTKFQSDNLNQEELYEAADKVLSELKAMSEYSTPFLTKVNKREAPDYYNGIYIETQIEYVC